MSTRCKSDVAWLDISFNLPQFPRTQPSLLSKTLHRARAAGLTFPRTQRTCAFQAVPVMYYPERTPAEDSQSFGGVD
jgi:hypothetical protein